MNFLDAEDQVFSHYANEFPQSEIDKARLEFTKLSGPFDEESEALLEEKMTHFREWFLFDYKVNGEPISNRFSEEVFNKLGLSEKCLKTLSSPVKGIFTFIKSKKEHVYIKDLFTKEKTMVEESPYLAGIDKGTYLQARVFKVDEKKYSFGQSIITHPYEANKYIDKKIKIVKKEMKKVDDTDFLKEDFLKELFSMRYHLLKYRQLEVKQIYSDSSPVKELLLKSAN